MKYLYYTLSPKRSVKVTVQSPCAQPRTLDITSVSTPKPESISVAVDVDSGRMVSDEESDKRANGVHRSGDIVIWKLAAFDVPPEELDREFDQIVKGASALVVLVDADSASAAEVLARVVQIEKRGVVVGDRSAGSVMQGVQIADAIEVPGAEDEFVMIPYACSVTNADLIMTDGKSLEHAGVVPGEIVVPTAEDLMTGRDPALARAAALVGLALDPRAAGRIFPIVWK